jgi:hypothetical protein
MIGSVLCREDSVSERVIPTCVPSPPVSRNGFDRDCATCEIRDGIPTTKGWGYYASRGGAPMLVMERRTDQRIRINGVIEIIVLEADNGKVRLGIECAPSLHGRVRH